MVVIRSIRESDAEAWFRLRHALWPDHTRTEFDEESVAMLANASREGVFVAERDDGTLCGLVEISIRDTAIGCRTRNVGYLEGWYVDPAHPGQGIGRRLVEAAESWARERGCTEMASDTTSDYPVSPEAHASLGYEEVHRVVFFRKGLNPRN